MLKRFDNLKIRKKLLLGFGIVIVLTVILAATSILVMRNIDDTYTDLQNGMIKGTEIGLETGREYAMARQELLMMAYKADDAAAYENARSQFYASIDTLRQLIDEQMEVMIKDAEKTGISIESEMKVIEGLKKSITVDYAAFGQRVDNAIAEGRLSDIKDIVAEGGLVANQIDKTLNEFVNGIKEETHDLSKETTKTTGNTIFAITAFAVLMVLLSVACALVIANAIRKPIQSLANVAKEIAVGRLDMEVSSNAKDEIGDLTRDLGIVVDTLKDLIKGIDTMAKEFGEGDIEAKIDDVRFQGSYKTVAEGVNSMVGGIISEVLLFTDCMKEFGNGNFNVDIPKFPGKKAVMNQDLDTLRNNLKSVASDISLLVGDAIQGRLSSRADVNKYKGDWSELLNGLNRLMEAIAAPINEAVGVLQQVSAGNFDNKVEGSYQGDFLTIKNSINSTVTNVASYIDEISEVLGALSRDDLDQTITREYVGKFSNIKDALNNIIDKLNTVISDIYSAADQVATGAKMISENSMTLAAGATEQASSVEELNATIMAINENTAQNAKSAKEAEDLSAASKNGAIIGDQDMKNMLASMNGISNSSTNIAKIIKVIDDIAIQTNLLALNAAVEAARAGQHGKGFSVVAEEVRSLASKSKNAAREIAELIEESIGRVDEGTKTAGTTANALQTIVDDVTKVAGIITNIAHASNEQAVAVNQVTEGLSQVAQVVQSNSATSEEAASASQQLSSQADIMKSMVSAFRLKKAKY